MSWLCGVIVSGIGCGLAIIALTLPWISAKTPYTAGSALTVTDLGAQAPLFAVLLILAALLVAFGFTVHRRLTAPARMLIVLITPVPAAAALLVGLRPGLAALRKTLSNVDATQDIHAIPMSGLVLYVAGLVLVGMGLIFAQFGSTHHISLSSSPESTRSSRQTILARCLTFIPAVPATLFSLTLEWFRVDNTVNQLPPWTSDWQAIYRNGIVGVLVALFGIVVTTGNARRIARGVGAYLCCGLISLLFTNAVLLWDPSNTVSQFDIESGSVRAGSAYFAAMLAVPLLLTVLFGVGRTADAARPPVNLATRMDA